MNTHRRYATNEIAAMVAKVIRLGQSMFGNHRQKIRQIFFEKWTITINKLTCFPTVIVHTAQQSLQTLYNFNCRILVIKSSEKYFEESKYFAKQSSNTTWWHRDVYIHDISRHIFTISIVYVIIIIFTNNFVYVYKYIYIYCTKSILSDYTLFQRL